MAEPTIDDYKRRLERLLSNALMESRRARTKLALEGAQHGHYTENSSGFRLLESELAQTLLVAAMETALTECRRVSVRTNLDAGEVFKITVEALSMHLDVLISIVMPAPAEAFRQRGIDLSAHVSDTYGRLRDLMAEIFWEFDHGLYALPGDQVTPVTINVANVHGSQVESIQQSGSESTQRRGSRE